VTETEAARLRFPKNAGRNLHTEGGGTSALIFREGVEGDVVLGGSKPQRGIGWAKITPISARHFWGGAQTRAGRAEKEKRIGLGGTRKSRFGKAGGVFPSRLPDRKVQGGKDGGARWGSVQLGGPPPTGPQTAKKKKKKQRKGGPPVFVFVGPSGRGGRVEGVCPKQVRVAKTEVEKKTAAAAAKACVRGIGRPLLTTDLVG